MSDQFPDSSVPNGGDTPLPTYDSQSLTDTDCEFTGGSPITGGDTPKPTYDSLSWIDTDCDVTGGSPIMGGDDPWEDIIPLVFSSPPQFSPPDVLDSVMEDGGSPITGGDTPKPTYDSLSWIDTDCDVTGGSPIMGGDDPWEDIIPLVFSSPPRFSPDVLDSVMEDLEGTNNSWEEKKSTDDSSLPDKPIGLLDSTMKDMQGADNSSDNTNAIDYSCVSFSDSPPNLLDAIMKDLEGAKNSSDEKKPVGDSTLADNLLDSAIKDFEGARAENMPLGDVVMSDFDCKLIAEITDDKREKCESGENSQAESEPTENMCEPENKALEGLLGSLSQSVAELKKDSERKDGEAAGTSGSTEKNRADEIEKEAIYESQQELTEEELKGVEELSKLPVEEILKITKELQEEAYELSLREARELARGRQLGIFKDLKTYKAKHYKK